MVLIGIGKDDSKVTMLCADQGRELIGRRDAKDYLTHRGIISSQELSLSPDQEPHSQVSPVLG